MGGSESKASEAVRPLWVADRDAAQCYNCGDKFTFTRRRHHCRCCGQALCAACWGVEIPLPAEFGYTKSRQRVCFVCEELVEGTLRLMRHPRRVVLTRTRRERADADAVQPPLSRANVAAAAFEVFFLKLSDWRPLGPHSNMQFSVTPRPVVVAVPSRSPRAASSPLLMKHQQREQEGQWQQQQQQQRGRGRGERAGDDGGPRRVAFATSSIAAVPRSPTASPAAASAAASATGQQDSLGTEVCCSRQGRGRSCQLPCDAQLDVAWVLPIDAVLQVQLDFHVEGDYISIETAQETFRVQVADVELEGDSSSDGAGDGVAVAPLSEEGGVTITTSATSTAAAAAAATSAKSTGRGDGGSGSCSLGGQRDAINGGSACTPTPLSSRPPEGAKFWLNPEATAELLRDLRNLVTRVSDRERRRNGIMRHKKKSFTTA